MEELKIKREKITGDEIAAPIWVEGNLGQMNSVGGLTIRQHFAAMAMQGLLSHGDHTEKDLIGADERRVIANYSVQFADALITELNK